MDMSYAIISVFNQTKKLYRETHMKYMVSNQNIPTNTLVYSIHSNLNSFTFYNDNNINEQIKENDEEVNLSKHSDLSSKEENHDPHTNNPKKHLSDKYEVETLWNISFDRSCSKTSAGASIWIHNTSQGHAFRLEFQCTNNIAEYEALLLGLHLLKDLGAKKVSA